uniref:Uncharacterized protein n=1 Tax=Rhodopseudomonas palustris (strain ATCC BAA-98 / CGA009) TaxID=258594 RepID=Q6N4A1_RHOPA|nr:hypothetical protein RPA3438 [Rhodopseudomonas palustris CGA009]
MSAMLVRPGAVFNESIEDRSCLAFRIAGQLGSLAARELAAKYGFAQQRPVALGILLAQVSSSHQISMRRCISAVRKGSPERRSGRRS